jgi:hypothetical protein
LERKKYSAVTLQACATGVFAGGQGASILLMLQKKDTILSRGFTYCYFKGSLIQSTSSQSIYGVVDVSIFAGVVYRLFVDASGWLW